jgi:hypothetical protein
MELLKQYTEELNKDLIINDLNVKEVQMRLPARKHFWAGRLINAKIELTKLEKKEKHTRDEVFKKINDLSQVTLSHGAITQAVNNSPDIIKITEQIKEYKYIIEYLEKVEKIFSSMTFDVGNIIKLIQLEQT